VSMASDPPNSESAASTIALAESIAVTESDLYTDSIWM
jgi:hypothetical protein